jgi:hypothetical protein
MTNSVIDVVCPELKIPAGESMPCSLITRAQGEISTITKIYWPKKTVPKSENYDDEFILVGGKVESHLSTLLKQILTANFENGI